MAAKAGGAGGAASPSKKGDMDLAKITFITDRIQSERASQLNFYSTWGPILGNGDYPVSITDDIARRKAELEELKKKTAVEALSSTMSDAMKASAGKSLETGLKVKGSSFKV